MTHTEAYARQYISDRHLIQLTQSLTTAIAYSKPEDPVEFLINTVKQLKESRDNGKDVMVCFTDADIHAMFTVLDPFNKKTVTRAQMEGAMLNFGVDEDVIESLLGEENGPYEEGRFTELIKNGYRATILP